MLFNDSWIRAINSTIFHPSRWAISARSHHFTPSPLLTLTNILDPGWKIKSRFARLFAVSSDEFVWAPSCSSLCDVTPSDEIFTITKIIAMLAMMLFEFFSNIFTQQHKKWREETVGIRVMRARKFNLVDFNWTRSEISSTSGVIDAASLFQRRLKNEFFAYPPSLSLLFVTIWLSTRTNEQATACVGASTLNALRWIKRANSFVLIFRSRNSFQNENCVCFRFRDFFVCNNLKVHDTYSIFFIRLGNNRLL